MPIQDCQECARVAPPLLQPAIPCTLSSRCGWRVVHGGCQWCVCVLVPRCFTVKRYASPSQIGSMYTYEMAPVFLLMESTVLAHMRSLCGWKGGDGIFWPGGSISNMMAMHVARFRRCPEVKTKVQLWMLRVLVFPFQGRLTLSFFATSRVILL